MDPSASQNTGNLKYEWLTYDLCITKWDRTKYRIPLSSAQCTNYKNVVRKLLSDHDIKIYNSYFFYYK